MDMLKKNHLIRMLVFIRFYMDSIQVELEKNIKKCENDWKDVFVASNASKAHADVGRLKRGAGRPHRGLDSVHKKFDF